jgi:hypothetical protein
MTGHRTSLLAFLCLLAGTLLSAARAGYGGEDDEARKKAERVASYVCLAETVSRVGLQVGAMLDAHPQDRALTTYAQELARLHENLYAKLTPPEGAEVLHKKFRDALTNFSKAAEGYAAADYTSAAKYRGECIRDFNAALVQVIKMKQRGALP